ncbi:hypothetical protein N7456_002387 [Penicillium angulare]|uniref:Uncharacterized protein n=1 Tax=Penicillium angulare TaxID=116970 RepID=A0A9W9G8K3_9EURO|nr:hypothetical protein N7456_002387 [Penicillium angulare]
MYGMSVSCSAEGGMAGFGVHFRRKSGVITQHTSSIWQGTYGDCILHIRFKPEEQITAIWVIYYDGIFDHPYLRIQSSEGISFDLAPGLPKSQTGTHLLADACRGIILGIYYENSLGTSLRTSSFGAFQDPEAVLEKQNKPISLLPDYRRMLPRLGGSPWARFSSQAIFENVSFLETCSIGSRCKGMMLTCLDGHEKVLGQWHEDTLTENVTIRRLDPLHHQGLCLFLSHGNEFPYVERVELQPFNRSGGSSHLSTQEKVEIYYGSRIRGNRIAQVSSAR